MKAFNKLYTTFMCIIIAVVVRNTMLTSAVTRRQLPVQQQLQPGTVPTMNNAAVMPNTQPTAVAPVAQKKQLLGTSTSAATSAQTKQRAPLGASSTQHKAPLKAPLKAPASTEEEVDEDEVGDDTADEDEDEDVDDEDEGLLEDTDTEKEPPTSNKSMSGPLNKRSAAADWAIALFVIIVILLISIIAYIIYNRHEDAKRREQEQADISVMTSHTPHPDEIITL